MLITLLEPVHADFSRRLSQSLELHLIKSKALNNSSTGLPSDDHTINEIIEDIHMQMSTSEATGGFILSNYPQNAIQAQSLDMALARIGQPVSSALMMESTKTPQNRENKALIRYYRSQNKLILLDETDNISQICCKMRLIYRKRRSTYRQNKR
ncbi:MAG: hypothetical protein ACN4GR_04380 [Arenicellales bacterium]